MTYREEEFRNRIFSLNGALLLSNLFIPWDWDIIIYMNIAGIFFNLMLIGWWKEFENFIYIEDELQKGGEDK